MTHQKPGRRGRNCEFILKKNNVAIKSFQTMGSIARLLKVCITTILNMVNKKREIKGFTVECIEKKPNYVKMFNLNGKLIGKFETITSAAEALKKKRKGNLSSLESGISFAIRAEISRFGYWWRRDGIQNPSIVEPSIGSLSKKFCSYIKYNEKDGIYEKCDKVFLSEGNHNRYCPSCQEYINLNLDGDYFKSPSKVSKNFDG